MDDAKSLIIKNLNDSISLKERCLQSDQFSDIFQDAANLVLDAYIAGGRLYIAGNGGSAADSQHLAAEFVSRFSIERNPLPAEALTVDSSVITAIANDYGYEFVFSRQLACKASFKDIFLAISTSGKSKNILEALRFCEQKRIKSILFTGNDGGEAVNLATYTIVIPSQSTALIQEVHIALAHSLCQYVEKKLFE